MQLSAHGGRNSASDKRKEKPYVLVAGVCEHDDRQASQCLNRAGPGEYPDFASILECIAFNEVVDNENYEVPNRNERDDARVLERIQTTEERKGYHNQPKRRMVSTL